MYCIIQFGTIGTYFVLLAMNRSKHVEQTKIVE